MGAIRFKENENGPFLNDTILYSLSTETFRNIDIAGTECTIPANQCRNLAEVERIMMEFLDN